ncbi:hypothetical protein FQN52_007164 [Onygenales sp. PD_12]|nr:hypothetical protein FQN53_007558 [Emmonsiellopsis sp. PD_33]KAK2787673.1 hypothetical protein FQN52_007164 [Onygenales sp. PD_12]
MALVTEDIQLDEESDDLLNDALDMLGGGDGLASDLVELDLDEESDGDGENLLNDALGMLGGGDVLTSDHVELDLGEDSKEDGDNLLDDALDMLGGGEDIAPGLSDHSLGEESEDEGGEDLLNDVWDVLGDGNESSTDDDSWNTTLVDPLEERVTSIRNGEHQFMSTLSHFTGILSRTGIDGPRHLKNQLNLKTSAVKVGTGAQFTVFRDGPGFTRNPGLVIKRVNLPLSRENGVRFAEGDDYRLQLRTLELEVRALCNPSLRNHRNMVHLVSWGYDYPLPDTPIPVLFMECALTTLTDFLKDENRELMGTNPLDVKHQMALDVSAGIQALHSLHIAHGDIKPDNVLIFHDAQNDKVPFCGKISDFGVCIDMEIPGSELTADDYRGTPGWVAPEVGDSSRWRKATFKPELMLRFDSYSLGLLIMSIFVKMGEPVDLRSRSESHLDVAIRLLREEKSISSELRMQLTKALRGLLAEDPWARSLPSPDLLRLDSAALCVSQVGRSGPRYVGTADQVYNKGANFWRRLDKSVVQELEEQYRTSKDSFASDVLFGLAQSITRSEPYVDKLLEYVTEAARGGFTPARAVYAQVMHAHGRSPEFGAKILDKWMLKAVSEGYLFSVPTKTIAQEELEAAKQKFRDMGGFAADPFLRKPDIIQTARVADKSAAWLAEGNSVVDQKGNTILHVAATLGSLDVVRKLLEGVGMSPDVQNDNLETPLYKACQAGHAHVIDYLLDKKAKASFSTKEENLTALHWLFTLREDYIRRIATRLIQEAGASVNAEMIPKIAENSGGAPQRIQILHFPFELPLGTPLHWAAFARNKTAMEALLDHSANVNAPHHGEDVGSSPLCLAAWYGEVEVARLLVSRGADVRAQDAKGRNVLHYMGYPLLEYHGSLDYPWHYWIRHGNWDEHLQQTTKLVEVLTAAGTPIDAEARVPRQMTPIKLASEEWDGGVICALAAMGADVEAGRGDTVLHRWAYIRGPKLAYPDAYHSVFKSICERTKNIDAKAIDQDNTPLHVIALGQHHEDEVEKAFDMIFGHSPKPNINAQNMRGWTALYAALLTDHDPARRAKYLVRKGASVVIHANDGKSVFFPITYNINLSDQQSHDLIVDLLSHLVQSEAGLVDIKQAYQKHFLSAPEAILTLSQAAIAGRVKTAELLLDLGLERGINKLVENDPPYTTLDIAIIRAEARRQAHIDSLASYTSNAARQRALATGDVYGKGYEASNREAPSRAAEAYSGAPKVLRLMRSRGAKRAWELEPVVSNANPPNIKDIYPKLDHQPDLWDVMDLYWLGFTIETQPNRQDWDILYELSRQPENWRSQLVGMLRELYEGGAWRPDIKMLDDAVKSQDSKDTGKDNVPQVPDKEFLREIMTMLAGIGKPESKKRTGKKAADGQKVVWIEARETTRYGANGLHRTAPGHVLQVELLGTKALGERRRIKEGDNNPSSCAVM